VGKAFARESTKPGSWRLCPRRTVYNTAIVGGEVRRDSLTATELAPAPAGKREGLAGENAMAGASRHEGGERGVWYLSSTGNEEGVGQENFLIRMALKILKSVTRSTLRRPAGPKRRYARWAGQGKTGGGTSVGAGLPSQHRRER